MMLKPRPPPGYAPVSRTLSLKRIKRYMNYFNQTLPTHSWVLQIDISSNGGSLGALLLLVSTPYY